MTGSTKSLVGWRGWGLSWRTQFREALGIIPSNDDICGALYGSGLRHERLWQSRADWRTHVEVREEEQMPHLAEIRFPARSEATSPSKPSSIVIGGRIRQIEISMEFMSGGELFHLALAGCVFNSIFRLARERGIELSGACVRAEGDFDKEGWSKGVSYDITLAGSASADSLRELGQDASAYSAIAVAIQKGAPVTLTGIQVTTEAEASI